MASREADESPDLQLVEDLIFTPRRLQLARFTREETLAGRTPDFRVLQQEKLVAFCEMKSPRDDWLDKQLDVAPPFTVVGGARSDPIFNRIARHVAKAGSQFDAVNPDRAFLNMLVFVNHDEMSHFADMHETLTGMFYAEGGERIETMSHIAERWIGHAKRRIDVFMWINALQRKLEGYMFNEEHMERVDQLCNLLGVDRGMIQR